MGRRLRKLDVLMLNIGRFGAMSWRLTSPSNDCGCGCLAVLNELRVVCGGGSVERDANMALLRTALRMDGKGDGCGRVVS